MEWAASLNWCLFSHVHHIRPCSLEITHQSLVKISSPAVSTWSSDHRGPGRLCLLNKAKERMGRNGRKKSAKLEAVGFVICGTRHYSYIPPRPTPQTCDAEKRLLSRFKNQAAAAPQRQQSAVNFLMEGGKFAFERDPTHSQTFRDFL